MDLVSTGKDVQLKLSLTGTDLIDILRTRDKSPARSVVFPDAAFSSDKKKELRPDDSIGLTVSSSSPAVSSSAGLKKKNSKGISRRRASASKKAGKTDLLACYSLRKGTLTLTGLLHQRLPVNFVLKPGTPSYGNFIKFLLKEVSALPSKKTKGEISTPDAQGSDYEMALSGLRYSLEDKLVELEREAKASADDITDILEVFASDFEAASAVSSGLSASLVKNTLDSSEANEPGRAIFGTNGHAFERKVRFFSGKDRVAPQLISGFLSIDIEEFGGERLFSAEVSKISAQEVLARLNKELSFSRPGRPSMLGGKLVLCQTVNVPSELLKHCEFFLHWGKLGNGGWKDEEFLPDEIVWEGPGRYVLRKEITPTSRGRFGATWCVRAVGSRKRIWAGSTGGGDVSFQVDSVSSDITSDNLRFDVIENIDVKGRLLQGLASFDQFVRVCSQLSKSSTVRGLGRLLFDITKTNPALRALVSDYYQRAVLELENQKTGASKTRIRTVLNVLKNIGIGEVVFVAPEGPHAIAGGLAQVIVGLSKSLTRHGVSCTIITPLYEFEQGNKHTSAEKLLSKGVQLLDKRVPIKRSGEIKISFGHTQVSGSNEIIEFPLTVRCRVYEAENEGLRIIFLRHPKLASSLYAPGWGDDQIRRALFLSRGALEVVRDRRFNITPHILVTNDWPSALVPVLLRTDPRYLSDSRLSGVETVHIMHNCGQGYQGRFPVNQFGEDLWPMLGIGGEHYFGLTDPEDRALLNFTAGAAVHSGKALVAVSKPYASQLLTKPGGEGLHQVFGRESNLLFGVSNGVDLGALRNLVWELGEDAHRELGLDPVMPKRFSSKRLIKKLPEYKAAAKCLVQRRYGLAQDNEAILVSLVGRLAEQKGISLLSGRAEGDAHSVMESVLLSYPQVQFFIGGPPVDGDSASEALRKEVSTLKERYPGRVYGVFDFIPHRDALEITHSSDIFLMPSRYEPGGITQLEALATGTLVVARNVGGIAATLVDYCPSRDEGNSFLFKEYSSLAFKQALCKALETIEDDTRRERLIARAAVAENDWSHRAPKYLSILQHVAGVFDPRTYYAHLAPRWHLLNSLRAV